MRILQLLLVPMMMLATGWLVRRRRVELSPQDIQPGKHYVVAPNHQSYLDSPMLLVMLPWRVLWRLAPLRVFVLNNVYDLPILHYWLRLTGFFPARQHAKHAYGLDAARKYMARGQTLVIFPEGGRTIRGSERVRSGVAVMAEWPEVMIIPVHLQWRRSGFWNRKVDLAVGKPFEARGMTPQQIMDRIYRLQI